MARLAATSEFPDAPSRSPWLVDAPIDLASFFAPAALVFALFFACVGWRVSPLPFLWLWLACFDGPHMFATYTRAYGDPELWRTRRPLLLASLAAFLVGPLLLGLGALARAPAVFTAFLGLMSVYSYIHVVRQHWGFSALYGARTQSPATTRERRLLYAACFLPYVSFVVTHPSIVGGLGLSDAARSGLSLFARALSLGYFAALALLGASLFKALRGRKFPHKQAYLVLVASFHGLTYLLVAGYEPVFHGAAGLDQQFMLLSIMTGVFHSCQYVVLVSLYHARSQSESVSWFGANPARYALLLLPFGALYLAVACGTSVYPGCSVWPGATASSFSGSQIALGLWWGFALHHYWLDERVWHVRSDARLRRAFGLG